MSDWLDRILYGLFPGRCILCTATTDRHLDLCLACERDLPRLSHPCWQCGLPSEQEICETCRQTMPPFSHCFSAFEYAAPIDMLIHQFKNQHKILTGKVLASVLGRFYVQEHLVLPDQWLPVPLHKQRLKSRGFNQALEIAEVLADMTQIPVHARLCRRIKNTQDQKTLSATQRIRNMKKVFTIDNELDGESIGIVDDVVTTTATVSALSHLLLDHGAGDVQVVCLARTAIGKL